MRSPAPKGPSNPQATSELSREEPAGQGFHGFCPLTANFTQVPNEIWDLKMPGLTVELRWTLVAMARETIGEAYRRGGSPYDFVAIPWKRWQELLDLESRNTVRARLARLEEMGLIEVLPGERGPWGTTANRYRLRWRNDGKAASRTFQATLHTRDREIARRGRPRTESGPTENAPGGSAANPPLTPGGSPANPPPRTPGGVCSRTPPGGMLPNPPSFKENKYKNTTDNNQPASPLVLGAQEAAVGPVERLAGGQAGVCPKAGFDGTPWLKGEALEPWPEPLLQALDGLLTPPQMAKVERRSPWSAEGAWAILQGFRVGGRTLDNQGGTLWNALVHQENGIPWLRKAGPLLRRLGWRMEPEDGTSSEDFLRSRGARTLAQEGFGRLPLHGPALERHRNMRAEAWRREAEAARINDDEDNEQEASMLQESAAPKLMPSEANAVPSHQVAVTDPEKLGPELKAELRRCIEAFREVNRALFRSPAVNKPGSLEAFTKSWEGIVNLLEPVLPLQVHLPDEYRPTAIRQRSQIKMNVVNAVYEAVS